MLKKIVLGTLFIGLIGVLVAGAVIRTMDRTERVAEAQGYGYRRSRSNGANVKEWLTVQGTVISVDANTLVVQTDSGEHVTVENRAWWFAQEQGFSAQVGDQVTLVGFYEGNDPSTISGQCLEVGRIDDLTNGQTVLVRDENGRPLWAECGRRGG